jgi:hypothetical protein
MLFIAFGLPLGLGCKPSNPKLVKSFRHLIITDSDGMLNFKQLSRKDKKYLSIDFNTLSLKATE